jgi:hypothetical protein
VADARIMGGFFVLVGLGICLLALVGGGSSRESQLLASSSAIMLLGPGVVYLVESRFLRRGESWAASLGLRTVAAHLGMIALVFLLAALGIVRLIGSIVLVPATINVFFIPALAAFAVHTARARREAAVRDGLGRAFETLPVAQRSSSDDERT